ncbi:MAG: hypothetical protein ACYDEZ_09450 [Methanoregula sp.]
MGGDPKYTARPPLSKAEHTFTAPVPPAYIAAAAIVMIAKSEVTTLTVQRIETGTTDGDELGFTGDLFSGWLERESGNRLYLHYIISRHRDEGHTQALIRSWLDQGYDVRVLMPRPIMQHILKKFRFAPMLEYFPDQYEDKVVVWYRPVNAEGSGMSPVKPAAAGTS